MMEYDTAHTHHPPPPALVLNKQRYDSGESGIFSVTECSCGTGPKSSPCPSCPSSPLQARLQDPATTAPGPLVNDQPLDMSKKNVQMFAGGAAGAVRRPSAPHMSPLSHREQFKSLYLLVDAAVGLLEKEESLRRCQATSCA